MKNEFNSYFFNELYEENRDGNYLDSKRWIPFFEKVAKKIVDQFNPTTVLDAGCACGYLVAALRDLGVQAYGFDISKFAISTARADIQDYCFVHSITEPLPKEFPKTYDLVVTSEVLELLFPQEGEQAISLLCQYSDTIVFSSCPTAEDRTHVNVQLPEYWAELFYNHSFAKNFIFDMTVLSPWCVVYERFSDLKKLVFKYEQNMRIDRMTTEKNVHQTINDLMESLLNVNSLIYFEDEEGYNEDNFALVPQQLNDSYLSLSIRLPEGCKSVKFVPVESEYCVMKNIEIYVDNRQITDYETNGEVVENYLLFNSLEPYFIINDTTNRKFLKIHAKFHHLEEEFLQLYEAKNRTSDLSNKTLNEEIVGTRSQFEEIQEALATHDQQIAEKEEEIQDKLAIIDLQLSTLAEKDELIDKLKTEIPENTSTLEALQAQLDNRDQRFEQMQGEMQGQKETYESQLATLRSELQDTKDSLMAAQASLESSQAAPAPAGEELISPEELEQLKQALEAKETALTEAVTASEAVTAELNALKEAPAPAAEAVDVEAAIAEALSEKEGIIAGYEAQVSELNNGLAVKDETIIEKINQIEELKTSLTAKEAELAELSAQEAPPVDTAALEEKEALLSEKDALLAEKEAVIAEKDAVIAEKDQALVEKEAIIDEKTVELNEKELVLMEKSSALSKKEAAYAELLPKVEEAERRLVEKEESYINIDDEMVEKNLQINNLEGRLQLIEGEYESLRSNNENLLNNLSKAQEELESLKGASPFKKKEASKSKGFSFGKSTKEKAEKPEKEGKEKKEKPVKEKKEKPVKEKKEKAVKEKKEKPVKEKASKEKKEKPSKDKKEKSAKGKKGKSVEEEAPEIVEDDFVMPTDQADFVPPDLELDPEMDLRPVKDADSLYQEEEESLQEAPEAAEAPAVGDDLDVAQFEETELEELSTSEEDATAKPPSEEED